VIGSSRTFMGEEAAGFDALRIACARIEAGQSDICLVGGSFNAQRPDVFQHYAMGHKAWHGRFAPVWSRAPSGGLILGSVGCFLVVEARGHARARGVTPKARISGVRTGRCGRAPGEAAANAASQIASLGLASANAVISTAGGVAPATAEERSFLDGLGLPVRAVATAIGTSLEPSFLASVALAAMSIERGELFPPLEPAEAALDEPLSGLFVTCWGTWRGEATALVTPV
jgi:3-oxoacyl-[acyl-carrier-protein] synthase II